MQPRYVLSIILLSAAAAACAPKTPQVSPSGSASPAAGQHIYNGNCLPCHQESGAGIPGVYPSLSGSPVVNGDPKELALWVLKGQRSPSMPTGRYTTQMLQFGWMKPADAAALLTYVRSSFGNSAPPVDADAVAQAVGK